MPESFISIQAICTKQLKGSLRVFKLENTDSYI